MASIILSAIIYCVRFKFIRRNVATHPMHVVVLAQPPPHHQMQYTQACYSIPMEQPPPPYNAVVATMDTNYYTKQISNEM